MKAMGLLVVGLGLAMAFSGTVDAQNIFRIQDTDASPGGQAAVMVLLTNDAAVQGYQTALTYDATVLTLVDMSFTGLDVENELAPETIEFFLTNIDDNMQPGMGWGAVAAIFDSGTPFMGQTIPSGTDKSIVSYNFQVANDPGLVNTSSFLIFQDGFGPPPGIDNVISINQTSISPSLVNGSINVVDSVTFVRGDTNQDGQVDVADGIFLIQYLFNNGASPGCFTAGDSNNDHSLDVADFIYSIAYQFLGGPPPAAPFPGCGVEADPNALPCVSFGPCS